MSVLQPELEIFSMVLGYQKRYWWQLSTVLEQQHWEGYLPPRIRCIASVSRRDPWFDWNLKLLQVFRDQYGLDLVLDVWEADNVNYGRRGYVRTRNLQAATAPWVMFNDGDMLYPPSFFAKQKVRAELHAGDHRVLAAGRSSMAFESGYQLIDAQSYQAPIQNAYRLALGVPTWLAAGGRVSGAGFHQLIDLQAAKAFAATQGQPLVYVPDSYSHDNNIVSSGTVRHETRSDRAARIRLGGVVRLSDNSDDVLTGQLHLNHWRRQDPAWRADLQH